MRYIFPRYIAATISFLSLQMLLLAGATAYAQSQYNTGWQQPNRWQLGVQVQNTTTGALLTQVVPGSAAANGGLTVGDRVLAVGGYQVGYVDNRLIDLGDRINQSINPNGQVTMLVMTTRNGLQSGPLSLTTSGGLIQGTAIFQGPPTRVSPQAVLNVKLLDTSYNNWNGGIVVAQTSVAQINRSPLQFQLTYNPAQIYADHQYAVIADVTDQGRIMYRSDRSVPVVPSSGTAQVVLSPVGTTTALAVPNDQVSAWYQNYLGRDPSPQEIYTWANHLNRGQPASDIQAYLLGSSEYFDRYQNDPNLYVNGVYRSLYGTDPTFQQNQFLRQQYDLSNGVRSQFVQQLMRTQGGF